jgi:hypothetical protein
MASAGMPADPFASERSELGESLSEGWLLWDSLKSYGGVRAFFNALDALDAPDLRNALVAARSDATVNSGSRDRED